MADKMNVRQSRRPSRFSPLDGSVSQPELTVKLGQSTSSRLDCRDGLEISVQWMDGWMVGGWMDGALVCFTQQI